jgi:hypothetical protein
MVIIIFFSLKAAPAPEPPEQFILFFSFWSVFINALQKEWI